MTDRATRNELRTIAEALHVPVERVAYLEPLGAGQLSAVRARIAARLHTRYAEEYRRLDRIGRWLPQRVAVPYATRVLPPRMLGRALSAALLHDRGGWSTAVLERIDPAVVADAAPFIDPAVIVRVGRLAPPRLVAEVMEELIRRKDFGTADLFVEYLTAHMAEQPDTAPVPVRRRTRRLSLLTRGKG